MAISYDTPAARRAAILAGELTISGGDGDEAPEAPAEGATSGDASTTDAPAPEATTEGTTDAPTAEAPAEGETPAADAEQPAPEAATETAMFADLPALPEVPAILDALDENQLIDLWNELEAGFAPRREVASTREEAAFLRQLRADQDRIEQTVTARRSRVEDVTNELAELDAPRTAPERAPAFAGARMSAADVADNRPEQPAAELAPQPASPRPRVAAVASAGIEGTQMGAVMTLPEIGRAIDRAKMGEYGEVRLASIPAFEDQVLDDAGVNIPELLTGTDTDRNDRLIREGVEDFCYERAVRRASAMRANGATTEDPERPARTAAICEPLDIIREIPDAFSTAQRVAPAFPARPIGRLGFQFTPSMHLSDMASGVATWTETNQAAVDVTNTATWKPIVDVSCPTALKVKAQASVAAFRFDITTEMSLPERIGNATNAIMAQKTRNKEAGLLALIDAYCGAYSYTGVYGALPTFARALNQLITQMAYVDRLDEPNYTVFIPRAVSTLLGVDRVARAFGQDMLPVDVLTELRQMLDGVGEVIETLDAASGEPGYPLFKIQEPGDAKINIPDLAGDYRVRVVDPTGAIYGETGELNMGVTRSPDLLRQNKALYFVEDFYLLAKHGPQHWSYIDMHLCDNGARAGFLTPANCSTAS